MGRRSKDALTAMRVRAAGRARMDRHGTAQDPVAADFQKVTLDENTQNPMELDVAPDGRVFYIERDGRLRIWKPNTQQTVTAGTVPVTTSQENGLLGLQLAPGLRFQQLGLPLLLAAAGQHEHPDRSRASRSTATRSTSAPSSASSPSSTSARSAATRPARSTSAPTAASTSPRATTRTRTTPAASTRSTSARPRGLGRTAHRRQHERPQRQDHPDQADGDPAWRRRASARRTRSRPATSSTRRWTRLTRPGRRSSAWASATRSASRSILKRAGS